MIALAQIIKDTEPIDIIARCWYSVLPYVDGAYITVNGKTDKETKEAKILISQMKEVIEKRGYKNVVIDYIKWEKDFAKARNHNFSQVDKKYEYIIWLDADDVLRGGGNLKGIEDLIRGKDIGAVFFNYLYKVEMGEEDGKIIVKNVLIEHLRERLIKNDGTYKWVSPIHETLIPQRVTQQTDNQSCDVVHLTSDSRFESAMDRNIDILETQLESQGDKKDPRTIYYLAKSYFDMRTKEYWDKAEKLITMYLEGSEVNTPSGWGEERAQAWEYLSEIYRERGEFNKAVKCIANALIEEPKFPNLYIDMALIYAHKEDWKKARFWVQLSQSVPYPKTTLVLNPRDMKVRILEILFNASVAENDLKGAWATAQQQAELVPQEPLYQQRKEAMDGLMKQNEAMTHIVSLANYLRDTKQEDKIMDLIRSIPKELDEDPIMTSLRNSFTPARVWGKDEIAIMCGKGFEQWSPKNLDKGIGGSEEAVIYLSNELVKLGWKITVYGDPQSDIGNYGGVKYLPYYYFNQNDVFNILIGWRSPGFFDFVWKSDRNYLWLHDIQNPQEYSKKRVDNINKIFALSKWHRENMPNVPDDKFMVSANGINMSHFEELDKKGIVRDPHKMIWTSSYDRGLEHLLKMWPKILEEVPDATLEVFYGWKLFENFYRNNPERMAWKEKMDKLMTQKGITHHGRVGQKEVLEWTFRSGIWAYPTHFGEISCITAMKCQAAGAIPVVCDYAALDETVQYGVKIHTPSGEDIYDPDKQEEFGKALIKALKDTDWQESVRNEMIPWARDKFTWAKVAKQWSDEFKRDYVLEASRNLIKEHPEMKKYLPYQVQEKEGLNVTY